MRALVVLVLLGCGTKSSTAPTGTGAPPPPAPADAAIVIAPDAAPRPPGPLDRDLPRLAARSVALYEAIVAAFRAAGGDCAVASAKLGALRTEFAAVVTANAKILHEDRGRELQGALAKHADKLDAAAKEIVGSPTLSKCAGDRAFTKSYDDLVGTP